MLESILPTALLTTLLVTAFGWLGAIWVNRVVSSEKAIIGERLQSFQRRLDYSLNISESIFEKEFDACVETWRSVLKMAAEAQYIGRDVKNRIKPTDQVEKCYLQHTETHDILYRNAPFYPEAIRDAAFDTAAIIQEIYKESEQLIENDDWLRLIETLYEEKILLVRQEIERFESAIRERYIATEPLNSSCRPTEHV
jgi:hypothetical protein